MICPSACLSAHLICFMRLFKDCLTSKAWSPAHPASLVSSLHINCIRSFMLLEIILTLKKAQATTGYPMKKVTIISVIFGYVGDLDRIKNGVDLPLFCDLETCIPHWFVANMPKRAAPENISKTQKLQQSKRPKLLPSKRRSDAKPAKRVQWKNRERTLFVCSRGVSALGRHLMKDLIHMMPHSKSDTKLDTKKDIPLVNEIAEIRNATKVVFFEGRKKHDLYMWLSCVPSGPSAKFLVENMRTTAELKMTGNALRYSRPILSFDPSFDDSAMPHLQLLKEVFIQSFGTPNFHPKMQPYTDKVISVIWFAGRIWFRVYQIIEESGALSEIGPRFSLFPMKIFLGSFRGAVIWENPKYISPNKIRQALRMEKRTKYMERVEAKKRTNRRKSLRTVLHEVDETDDIFE
ncbi:Ribosome biogenesis protein BRX1 -like protein [Echinococcus granulosus]|uniref:Ribosome biogenesis protein BRX1 homolog n=2 Tax=Echinococcus granulosus TaxID=6210 RepID=A0A068WT87_ECHGR|nr:Ribosome biogenesis protein BRX1 -like protein [Echinococcus granulosus]CDS23361.1 ribosome biogenesis protein brx1 [Echinococcus granulosus]